jgi:hypothetical protein
MVNPVQLELALSCPQFATGLIEQSRKGKVHRMTILIWRASFHIFNFIVMADCQPGGFDMLPGALPNMDTSFND